MIRPWGHPGLGNPAKATVPALPLQQRPSLSPHPTHLRFSNSSSFSASFLSMSALIWFSSSWMRRVLLSSCSRAP